MIGSVTALYQLKAWQIWHQDSIALVPRVLLYVLNVHIYIGIAPDEGLTTTYDVSVHLMRSYRNTGRHLTDQ